ncbi:MAG: metalloregulator ArsR/SmtB family transcription factor [Actinomycetota bacterium]|nr:metalloregulator ArsR/SmtB family transcription factor [Actinomycetota bacterium]
MQGREFKDAVFEQFARVASAFSSPKRVEIVDLLAQGERAVELIAEATGMTMANTSRHLQVLRQANLVSTRRQGIQVWYRVADPSVIEGYRDLWAMTEARIGEVSALAEAFFGDVDGAEPVGIAELVARADSGKVLVVDVRPRLEFEAGHLPGALNIPLEDLAGRISELDQSTAVVAYCRGPYCVLSAQAVAQLRRAGLDAQRLDGGPLEWDAAGLPLAVGA